MKLCKERERDPSAHPDSCVLIHLENLSATLPLSEKEVDQDIQCFPSGSGGVIQVVFVCIIYMYMFLMRDVRLKEMAKEMAK